MIRVKLNKSNFGHADSKSWWDLRATYLHIPSSTSLFMLVSRCQRADGHMLVLRVAWPLGCEVSSMLRGPSLLQCLA